MKQLCKIVLIILILSTYWPWHGFAGVKGVNEDAIDEETIEEDGEDEESPEVNQVALNLTTSTYSLGGFPRATAIMDIDSDGDSDIVVTNSKNHNIVILLNKGDGTFETGDSYPVEGYPIAITSIDIDNDTDIDIAVLDSEGMVRVFKEDGSHKFSPAGNYIVGVFSFSISPYDVDRDRDTDLIILSADTTNILLNGGMGGFNTKLAYQKNITSPTTITADLNSDERDDMVIGDKEGIAVLLNNGTDTFARGVYYATGEMPIAVAAGDLDSDDDDDLVVANFKGNTVSILRNDGDGGFQEVVDYPSGEGPNSISLWDIDEDEDMDIIVTNGKSGDLAIFINNTVRPLTITTDSFPQGRVGLYYEENLEAQGGVPPYRWGIIEGSLPPSLHLDPLTGEIVSISRHGGEIVSETTGSRDDREEDTRSGEEDDADDLEEEAAGEPLINLGPPCYCLKAPLGLYRFTVKVADSSSASATASLFIEVLPNPGIVSGTIRYSGEKKGKIKVGLWSQSQPELMAFFGRPIFSTTIGTSGETSGAGGEGGYSGEYKIEGVYPESYLVAAFLDINGDGLRQMGEPYGVFGSSGTGGNPEPVVVDNGAVLTGIDIGLK